MFNWIKELFAPATKLIDELFTSDEERAIAKNKFESIQNEFYGKVIEYESKLLEAKASIIVAEANGSSWIQKSWRPILMLIFAILIVCYWFGFTAPNLPEETILELFSIIKIGIGGYIIGRSGEKIADKLKDKKVFK